VSKLIELFKSRVGEARFEGDYYLLVWDETDGLAYSDHGADGLAAVWLAVNAMCEHLNGRGRPAGPVTGGTDPDVVSFEALVEEMRRYVGSQFVLCYRAGRGRQFRLAYSAGLTCKMAYTELLLHLGECLLPDVSSRLVGLVQLPAEA
jgi:hypothetical protein